MLGGSGLKWNFFNNYASKSILNTLTNHNGGCMKKCIRCKQMKEESEFNMRNIQRGYLQSVCKHCQQEQAKNRYESNKDTVKKINKTARAKSRDEGRRLIFEFLSNKVCADCGEKDISVLTFDHVRGKKKMNISDMVAQGYGADSIQREIAKTDVICFNCHMRREQKRRGVDRFGAVLKK